MSKLLTLVTAVAALLALATPAHASSVKVSDGDVVYTGSAGRNAVDVSTSLGGVLVVRDSARLRAGDGCLTLGPTEAVCQAEGVDRIVATLAGGADTFRSATPFPVVVDGGTGNDRLAGSRRPDFLSGGPGDDTVLARDGLRDAVQCGAGDDRVDNDFPSETGGCERSRRAAPASVAAGVDPPPSPPLSPSTVTVADGALEYRAGGPYRHVVAIRRAGDGELVIRDSSLLLARAAACRNVTFTEVRCAGRAIARIRVVLNRRDSRVRSKAPLPVGVRVSARATRKDS